MRIAHVVTLLSPDGAYGGPVRVALNQLRQLQEMGHAVCLYAAYRGYEHPPTEMNGVPVRAFKARRVLPRTGFAGLTSPALFAKLWRDLPRYDVVHVHLARDLVTLPSASLALRADVPLVVQTHGMVDRSSHPLATPLDTLLTNRILRSSSRVLYLTEHEKQDLKEVGGSSLKLTHLVNGVPGVSGASFPQNHGTEVLFLARLQSRKRPVEFALAATELASEFPDVTFSIVGPDEGEAAKVSEIVHVSPHSARITLEGPLPPELTLARMSHASIYVLPSINEPFPMSVLEAASVGLPVITTSSSGLAESLLEFGAGIIVDETTQSLTAAIRELLTNSDMRLSMGQNARRMAAARFSMTAIGAQLEALYTSIGLNSGRSSHAGT